MANLRINQFPNTTTLDNGDFIPLEKTGPGDTSHILGSDLKSQVLGTLVADVDALEIIVVDHESRIDVLELGGGSTSINSVTIDMGYPVGFSKLINVTDAGIVPASDIMVSWGNCLDTDINSPEMNEVSFMAKANTGSFDVMVTSTRLIGGPIKINYLVG